MIMLATRWCPVGKRVGVKIMGERQGERYCREYACEEKEK